MATASSHSDTNEVIAYKEDRQPVQLVYDTWTPQPYFIVVQREPQSEATSAELQATYEVIGRFLSANSKFDQEAILSFHRGQWYQQYTGKWHAHLCVPKQPYLQQAVNAIPAKKIPANKEWKGAKTLEQGMNEWHTRKLQEYAKYKNSCVQTGISAETSVEKIPLSPFNSNSTEFQLVWTTPAPRIGVVARSPATITLASLYTFMSRVRSDMSNELGRCNSKFSNFGCHLCLYVRGQSGTTVTCRQGQILTEAGKLDEEANIVGYIQMDESQYVQWLPRALKQVWLGAFSRAEHFVRT